MKYIECLGVHGSGKTTIAKEIAALLRARQAKVLTEREVKQAGIGNVLDHKSGFSRRILAMLAKFSRVRLVDSLWRKHQDSFMIRVIREQPELVRQVITYIKQFESPSWMAAGVITQETLLKRFFYWSGIYQVARTCMKDEEYLLIEEGFCQQAYNFIAFRKEGFENRELEQYLRLIPKPQLIVFLLTEPAQCEERLQKRPKYPRVLRSLTLEQKMDLLHRKLRVYESMTTYLESQGVDVIRLKNDEYAEMQQHLKEQLVGFGI